MEKCARRRTFLLDILCMGYIMTKKARGQLYEIRRKNAKKR